MDKDALLNFISYASAQRDIAVLTLKLAIKAADANGITMDEIAETSQLSHRDIDEVLYD